MATEFRNEGESLEEKLVRLQEANDRLIDDYCAILDAFNGQKRKLDVERDRRGQEQVEKDRLCGQLKIAQREILSLKQANTGLKIALDNAKEERDENNNNQRLNKMLADTINSLEASRKQVADTWDVNAEIRKNARVVEEQNEALRTALRFANTKISRDAQRKSARAEVEGRHLDRFRDLVRYEDGEEL